MQQITLENELEEIGRECNLQLLKNFAKLGISPWYSSGLSATAKPSSSALFLPYDPLNTCFRMLPNAPRRFEGALKVGILSKADTHLLSGRLLAFCQDKLARYNGFYSAELSGRVTQIIRRASEIHDHGLLDIEKDLLPDDLYMAIPWPASRRYFEVAGFAPIPKTRVLLAATEQPLTALAIGIDAVCAGPSVGLSPPTILAILDLLDGKRTDLPDAAVDPALRSRAVLPAISGGFHGVTMANFSKSPEANQHAVLHHLYQVGETIGQKCQEMRYRDARRILQTYDNILDVVKAFILILPPTERILVSKGLETVGLHVGHEHGCWAGYRQTPRDQFARVEVNAEVVCSDDKRGSIPGSGATDR